MDQEETHHFSDILLPSVISQPFFILILRNYLVEFIHVLAQFSKLYYYHQKVKVQNPQGPNFEICATKLSKTCCKKSCVIFHVLAQFPFTTSESELDY